MTAENLEKCFDFRGLRKCYFRKLERFSTAGKYRAQRSAFLRKLKIASAGYKISILRQTDLIGSVVLAMAYDQQ